MVIHTWLSLEIIYIKKVMYIKGNDRFGCSNNHFKSPNDQRTTVLLLLPWVYKCFTKNKYWIFFVYAKKILNAMFLANAKSNFGAIFLILNGIFRIIWKNSCFPYANQLWKISYLLYEMGPSLFAFVKHLYTYGVIFSFYLTGQTFTKKAFVL